MRKLLLTLLVLSYSFLTCYAQATWYWTRQADSATEYASYDAVDRNNNAYYTGTCSGTRIAFGNIGLNITGTYDDFLVKYDANGNPLWARNAEALNNGSRAIANSVTTDRNNNVIEVGEFEDSIAFGSYHLHNKYSTNSYIVKYDENGILQWATSALSNYASSNSYNGAYSVKTDMRNNVLVTGWFSDSVVFGNDTLVAPTSGVDMFLVKYGPAGNLLWAKAPVPLISFYGSSCYGFSVAVDDSGNSYVTGNFVDSIAFAPSIKIFDGSESVYLAKYDSNGKAKWAINTNAYNVSDFTAPDIVDKSGNVYLSCGFGNPTLTIGSYTLTNAAAPFESTLLAKYDRNGNPLWATCAKYKPGIDYYYFQPSCLAADRCNDVYWSGICSDTFAIGNVNITVPGAGQFSYVMKLDSNGNAITGEGFPTQSQQPNSNGIAIDSLSRILFDADLATTQMILGNDTVNEYMANQTSFLSKFSFSPIIQNITSSDTNPICPGDSVKLKLIYSSGTTYKWNTGATTDSIWVKPLNTTTYYVIVGEDCYVDTSFIKVKVIPLSISVNGTDSICKGDTVWLKGAGGITYLWSTSQTNDSIKVSPSATTTYTLTVFNGACQKDTTYTVHIPPNAIPVINIKGTNCIGAKDTLTVSGGNRYVWNNGLTSNKYITGILNTDSTFTVTAYNSLGCPMKDSIKIDVFPQPGITTAQENGCFDSPVIISALASGIGPFTYRWLPGGSTTDSIIVNDSARTYTVTVSNGCPISQTITLNPNIPKLNACCNETIRQGNDTSITAGGTKKYLWLPSTGLNCDTCSTVIASPTVTTTYTVIGTDAQGCQTEGVVTITVELPCADFIVPNVFTPDFAGPSGDNNLFYIKTQSLTSWSIIIYDRWGKEVFKSTNPYTYWDGTTQNGNKAPDGVYYYIINSNCDEKAYKKDGFVQVIR